MNKMCDGCGIMTGPGYIETGTVKVGNYEICGNCYQVLKKFGWLWVIPYQNKVVLLRDGSLELRKELVFSGRS